MSKSSSPWWRYGRLVAILLALTSGGCEVLFPPPLVGVIVWTTEVPAFLDNWQGVWEGLREEGFLDGINMRLRVINAMGRRDEAALAANEFQAAGARLLITVGTIPTLVALEVTRGGRLPLIYSMVATPEKHGLADPANPESARLTGTSSEVPAYEQLLFLLQAKPGLRRLGVLFCSATPQAVATGHDAVDAAGHLGLAACWEAVSDDRPELLQEAIDLLVAQRVEAVFLPADPVLATPRNLRFICERLQEVRLPLMAPTGSCVANGALLAYHADFIDLGRQAGRQAAHVLRGVPPYEVARQRPLVKRLTLNLAAAQGLGLTLPWQLLSRAQDFHR